jgi:hypothetical protein
MVSALVIGMPWILDFARYGMETWVPVVLGAGAIGYSLLTNYELGVSAMFSMRTHLALDMISGFLLAVSPWLFGFSKYIWQPFVVIGLLEIVIALLTRTITSRENIRRTITSH